MKANLLSFALILLGLLAVVSGVSLIYPPAGVILTGILVVAAGVSQLEASERGKKS